MLQIQDFMAQMAGHRPVFHSEADFQHAFAWQLHQKFPDAQIRLEYPFRAEKWIYIDIWSRLADQMHIAIELKYKTTRTELEHSGELYHLKNQGAQDIGRYDFLKDVQRLEDTISRSAHTVGYAILLTNDPGYWQQGRENTVDAAFRLHDNRTLHGEMKWDVSAPPRTIVGRKDSLKFPRQHHIRWQDYSNVPAAQRGGIFRYLALEI